MSGHGVCSTSRFTPRSIGATITFIAPGMLMATVVTRLLGGSVSLRGLDPKPAANRSDRGHGLAPI
jgi:uncharacterized membrane protein YedE/YeeE